MADDFWKKYKHPKWQEKRLRIMNRADFKCEHCSSKDETLAVHHSYYERDADPWDYPDASLRCLCKDCHEKHHDIAKDLRRFASVLPDYSIKNVIGYIKATTLIEGFAEFVELTSDSEADGFCRAFHVDHADFSWPWEPHDELPQFGSWSIDDETTLVNLREALFMRRKCDPVVFAATTG